MGFPLCFNLFSIHKSFLPGFIRRIFFFYFDNFLPMIVQYSVDVISFSDFCFPNKFIKRNCVKLIRRNIGTEFFAKINAYLPYKLCTISTAGEFFKSYIRGFFNRFQKSCICGFKIFFFSARYN